MYYYTTIHFPADAPAPAEIPSPIVKDHGASVLSDFAPKLTSPSLPSRSEVDYTQYAFTLSRDYMSSIDFVLALAIPPAAKVRITLLAAELPLEILFKSRTGENLEVIGNMLPEPLENRPKPLSLRS